MTSEMRKKEEDRQEQMAKMMMSFDLLTKHMLGTRTKSINYTKAHNASFLEEETMYASFDEDVRYLMNQGEGSQSRYQATNQGPWCPREENQGCIARDVTRSSKVLEDLKKVPKNVSNEKVDDGVSPSALIRIVVDEEVSKKQNVSVGEDKEINPLRPISLNVPLLILKMLDFDMDPKFNVGKPTKPPGKGRVVSVNKFVDDLVKDSWEEEVQPDIVETCDSVHWQDSATSALQLASCGCGWRVTNHAQVRGNCDTLALHNGCPEFCRESFHWGNNMAMLAEIMRAPKNTLGEIYALMWSTAISEVEAEEKEADMQHAMEPSPRKTAHLQRGRAESSASFEEHIDDTDNEIEVDDEKN
ncbi:hypothetical protein KY285_018621 [Solanum tuberosum]|nr:hypothetical protein KY284_016423 [Solanum tuberosum]KAH0704343.1 hypothetical protein KY285_018621 [Solanum tuberosum]